MAQIRDNKQKQTASDAVAALFLRACFPAGTMIYFVCADVARTKEAAP